MGQFVLLTQYFSGNQIEKNKRAGHIARMGENTGVYRGLVRKPKGKRQLERPRIRREDNIKMDLQEVECMDWIELAQDRDRGLAFVNVGSIKFGEFLD
jgi:hypothetical protein